MDDEDEASSSKNISLTESIQISEMEMLFDELKKLGEELDEGVYTDEHDQTINLIIGGIKELNSERRELHESLEVLTISTSKKRHALHMLPQQYNKNMKDAVLSVREKVEKKIDDKKRTVEISWTEKHQAEVVYKQLVEENSKLKPESEQAKLLHDKTVHALNNHINDKAQAQIYLKETIETIHEVKQRTKEYKVGIENLALDLEDYTKKSGEERNQVLKEIEELEKVIEEQDQVNAGLKKIDDEISSKLFEATIRRESELKKLKNLETSNGIMRNERSQLEKLVAERIPENEKLSHKRDYLCGAYDKLKEEFDHKINETTTKKDMASRDLAFNEKKMKELEEEKERSQKRREELGTVKVELEVVEREQTEYSAGIKQKLHEYEDTLDNMRLRNREMQDHLEGSKARHDNFVEMTRQRIEQYIKDIKHEKDERAKSLKMKEESGKELKEFQQSCNNYVEDVNKKIQECKDSYRSAVEETHELTRETRLNRRKNDQFCKEVELYRKRSVREREEWLMEIERLLDEIDSYKAENHKNQLIREERSLIVQGLRESLQLETSLYQKAKMEVIAARATHKNKLNEEEKMNRMMEHAEDEIQSRKLQLREEKEKVSQQLVKFDEDRKEVDLRIYNLFNLSEKINARNSHFVQKLKENHAAIEELRRKMDRYKKEESVELKMGLNQLTTNLWDLFNESKKTEIASTENDERIVQEMKDLGEFLSERTQESNTILTDMEYVLSDYNKFINTVETKRPKTSPPSTSRKRNKTKNKKSAKEEKKTSTKSEIISDLGIGPPLMKDKLAVC